MGLAPWGGVVTNNDETGFRTSVEQFKGAKKHLDLGVDSKLAVQGSAVFDSGFTVTAQVLGARKGTDDFDMGFEWLFLQYTGIEGLDLKGGRVVMPAFLVSDSRLVGYAIPWLRVSPLVYAMMPLSHVDGAQATYRRSIGPAVASVQVTGGGANGPAGTAAALPGLGVVNSTADSNTSRILGLNAMLEWGDWTFRASQIKGRSAVDTTVIVPAGALGPGSPSFPYTVGLEFDDKFQEFGLQYDDGKVVAVAEYVKRSTKNVQTQNGKAWYVAAGYRFGSVMPYAMLSQYTQTSTYAQDTNPPKAKGLALGGRYDFANNMAVKVEWAQYKNNSTYIFTDSISSGVADKKINVMSVALDFIF